MAVKKALIFTLVLIQIILIVNPFPDPAQPVMALTKDAKMQHQAGTITGPLQVSAINPRYFEDPDGNIVYLTGSHTWCNFMDCDDANPIMAVFNYPQFLNFLVSRNHNFFRLWRAENARGGEAGSDFWFNPMPYARSTVCCAFDGGNKFDLTRFNQAYFDRMRQRVIAAENQGIYVSIMLFDGWSVESKLGGHNPWQGHPFKLENNINHIDGDTNNNNQGSETHTLANSQVTALQEAYVRKVIDTVNDLDNVLYEISNESPANSEQWQYHLINYIKSYQATKPKQHPVGMTWEWPGGNNNDLYNSPADWISLGGAGDINTYTPPAATGNKVIIADTDHLCGICGNRQWAWKSFTRGENPIFMDVYNPATTGRGMFLAPTGHEAEIRANLGYTRKYANRINLKRMTPQPSLCSTGFCLAHAIADRAQYLAYLPSGGTIQLNLSASQGTLSVEWFSPATGGTVFGDPVSGGAIRQLTAPFGGDAVLFVSHTNTNVSVGGTIKGKYYLRGKGIRDTYTGANDGPVIVESSDGSMRIASQRVIYGGASYSESMGLPAQQLSREYLFPYYNNVAMQSQLRVSNLGGQSTTITVYLGTQQIDSFTLEAGAAERKSYPNANSGPMRVTSSVTDILTTIRVLYGSKSYSELMGLPVEHLSQDYWYPVYDNVNIDSQLRVSNVGARQTHIRVYLAGQQIDEYDLQAGEASRKTYPHNSGPLHVVSDPEPVLSTIRLLYQGSSYAEITGLPAGQLSQDYWYPMYDNASLDSQLRVANTGVSDTGVTVYAAGKLIDSFTLGADEEIRKSYSLNTGPLQVVSSARPIVSSVQMLYDTASFDSLYEMMGLSGGQLATQYYFPWYNNTAMKSELRFAAP